MSFWTLLGLGIAVLSLLAYLLFRLRELHHKRKQLEEKLEPMYEELEQIAEKGAE